MSLLGASGIPMCITEFSLYSIGINMLRQKLADRFLEFADDMLVAGQVRLLRLGPSDMTAIAGAARRFGQVRDTSHISERCQGAAERANG